MLRDLNVFRRNSGRIPPAKGNEENIPLDPSSSVAASAQLDLDPSRNPLHVIQEPIENNKAGNDPQAAANLRRKIERTPSGSQVRSNVFDGHPPFRTPEKLAAARSKFGWAPRAESRSNGGEICDESSYQSTGQLPGGSRGVGGGYGISTPRAYRMAGKASSVHSDSSSAQSTPTKSVSKPCYSGNSRPPLSSGPRTANFSAASKGVPMLFAPSVALSTSEVPHFELKEDPSFWMENNVQAVIRVRPLNSIEKSLQGYNRCLKQDSAQSIVWIGQPEARFTFDHVACETVSQEMLFRVAGLPMVENCMSGYNSCVFAYGQTGSGKTYTMLGEIDELEFRPSPERGMTPRIFEFLFARIKAEEESRRDEKLKYNCKCSFLEIYNEQITDLLDPASTNLLLREDLRKGVYVENLTEFEVESVRDILKLLIQGAANRKVAATNMNHESSRSHSVFTCAIESRWEKDSTTNLRFARLNLVDLAGSERQKASGAEGERLKEAANINKSLSTLGHVIMILADVAHGRQRHIPYRDSRLTFLLQDSLGGNSKTMIIANVSPSICCANETLSTLKFAQRARLIQNNAVINEDASGDVIALQHQIRLLKEELSVLKRQNVSRSLSFRAAIYEDFEGNGCDASPLEEMCDVGQGNVDGFHSSDSFPRISVSTKQLKSLEATLAGALRREKMADTAIRQLEAEIEQLNRLVRQREEDARSSKMMLKFREDKIHRMESLLNGLLPSDSYLLQENNALSEEIQLLRVKVDRNPEVTRFALENIRLLDQIRKFQDYYEDGERELLLNEVSELRDQRLQIFDGKYERDQHSKSDIGAKEETCEFTNLTTTDNHFLGMELEKTCNELEVCKNEVKCCLEINSKLHREINDLRTELDCLKSATHTQNISVDSHEEAMCLESPEANLHFHQRREDCMIEDTTNRSEQILNLQLELDILKDILKEEKSSRFEVEERAVHANNELNVANQRAADLCKLYDDVNIELKRARSVIEALESQHLISINEIEKLTGENGRYADLLKEQEQEMTVLRKRVLFHCEGEHKASSMLEEQHNRHMKKPEAEGSSLQVKMKCMQASLEKARTLNMKYQSDQASQTLHECEMDEVRRQVEAETAEVIVCLQEELIALQRLVDENNRDKLLGKESLEALQSEMKELNERLMFVTNDNHRLSELVEEKERELNSLMGDWDRLAYEIAEVLDNGNAVLEEASVQACTIVDSFPQRSWVGEQVGKMVRSIYEKDELIYELQNCLEDAQNIRSDMEWKLRSMRGATLAITEAQQQETSDKEREILSLTTQLSEKTSSLSELQGKIRLAEDQIRKSEEQLKLLLNQSEEILSQKDVLLQNLMLLHVDAEKQIQELKFQLAQHPGNTVKQAPEHAQEREETQELDHQIEKEGFALSRISNDLRRTRRRLNEFCVQVNPLQSHSNGCVDQTKEVAEVYNPGNITIKSGDTDTEDRAEIEMAYLIDCEQQIRHVLGDRLKSSLCKDSNISRSGGLMQNMYDREATIILLRKEIESALDSLEGVQAQMVELLQEKENRKTEMLNEESMDNLVAEVLKLKSELSNKEQQYEVRLLELENKLQMVEDNALTSHAYFCKAQEELELEVNAAKATATQKTVEASRLLAKIEEAQETMRDADAMVNALLAANKSAKQEIERLQKIETTLNYEMSGLMNDIQILQSSFDRREREYEDMENKFLASLTSERSLVLELEETLKHLKATFTEKLKVVSYDLDWLKSQLDDYAESTRVWLEDIWSEIIGKDCAVSVLHLCHMGIFLEMLTGLNTENSLLSRGLCESNSVIADLREHNVRSKKELEMCSILKGKLLADINNSFNRITKKEDEAVEFRAKISSFEKKIWNLQFQEESMLARSNSMGVELSMLMKELDVHNQNTIAAASVQEKLLQEKENINEQLVKKTRLLDEVRGTNEMFRSLVSEVLELLAVISHSTLHMAPYDLKSSSNVPEKVADLCEAVTCEAESLAISIFAKKFEVLVLQSELEQKIRECHHLTLHVDYLEGQRCSSASVVDRIMEEMILHELEWNLNHDEANYLLLENEMFKVDLLHLKEENSRVTEALQKTKVDIKCCSTKVITKELENKRLEDDICTLTACLTKLQTEMDMKNAELENLKCTHTVIMKELDLKIQAHEVEMERTNALVSENEDMKNLLASKRKEDETITMLISKFKSFIDSVQSMSMLVERIFNASYDAFFLFTETMQHKICQQKEMASKFVDEINFLELSAHELISRNLSLQSELARKDEASKVLLYDLSLLQESASIAQDKTDEVQELTATLTCLEDELARKACQCEEAFADKCMLQALLQENNEIISALRLELDEKYDALNLVSHENQKLKVNMEHIFETKAMIDEELREKSRVVESLEEELLKMRALLGQKDNCLKDLHSEIAELANEREYVDSRMLALKEELEMAQALAEENEAIATEARQLAEGRKTYAEEKEQEVRLLEKSVEELEHTVNAMESKVEMVKEEAERQRLQREEIELELQAVRHQMFIVPASAHVHCLAEDRDIEISRQLQDKVVELQDAHKKIKRLCKEVADKDAEILQCKAHISELNMHAEAQARECKQKFKELEAMAQQVRPEHASSCSSTSLASTKSEKTAAKSRASGSPFKCIGLGLAQQINSEKDEELTAARRQIEELEALVASKQKELFMLNTRLAAAESMTHDVIRDLLGVKLDITNYASLLDNQQAEKAKETENFDNHECQHKDLVLKLRKELNELIQERQSWLDDINRKQSELTALRVTMEKLRQREQTLTAENEMSKANISTHKKMVMELEHEVEKLTKQQNLQHRIHHHAKIKEENIFLKIQNDDLNARFQKSEALLSRVREELAHYRTASGKKPSIDLDEEEQLKRKLEETEEERIHLAKKLLRLSTSILKAAGFAQLASSPSTLAAENALHQLTNRINSLESELEDLKLKCQVYRERLRLAELEQEALPACLGDCGSYSSPSVTQSPSVQKKCFEDGNCSYGFSPS